MKLFSAQVFKKNLVSINTDNDVGFAYLETPVNKGESLIRLVAKKWYADAKPNNNSAYIEILARNTGIHFWPNLSGIVYGFI